MLLIQEVNLIWHKQERGGAAAVARRRFPYAYNWPAECGLHNVMLHRLNFYQQGENFLDDEAETRQSLQAYGQKMGLTQAEIDRRIVQRLWQAQKYAKQFYNSADDLNLTNLSLAYCGDNLQVDFCYDVQRSGRPARRGHNKDFANRQARMYSRDCLNENAFLLAPGQYGRVVWNERNVDYDTGGWYYQLHIYNLFYGSRGVPPADVLIVNKPDFVYEQLADLY